MINSDTSDSASPAINAHCCVDCGADISHRHGKTLRCPSCVLVRRVRRARAARASVNKPTRLCRDCGDDISTAHGRAERCRTCAGARKRKQQAARKRACYAIDAAYREQARARSRAVYAEFKAQGTCPHCGVDVSVPRQTVSHAPSCPQAVKRARSTALQRQRRQRRQQSG